MKMLLTILTVSTLLSSAIGRHNYDCSQKSTLLRVGRPLYDFSLNLLERVAHNEYGHFVFSPLSTWMQLNALAEGAKGRTLQELVSVTKFQTNGCYKTTFAGLIHRLSRGLKTKFRRESVIVIDELLEVNHKFIKDVFRFYRIKVLLKNFNYPASSARAVNDYISNGTNGVIKESLYAQDFNETVMLLSDNVYFKSAWKFPFDTDATQVETFKTSSGVPTGYVNMMSMTAYLNSVSIPHIHAKVLEIPCDRGYSMLVFLPLKDMWIGDVFFYLRRTTLKSILNQLATKRAKLTAVKMPRFQLNSTVDNLPELLGDMNIRKIFDAYTANFDKISKYSVFTSLMTQVADIEVTEAGVKATSSFASNLVNDTEDVEEFTINRPFAYMLIDRKTQIILFAGTYSNSGLY